MVMRMVFLYIVIISLAACHELDTSDWVVRLVKVEDGYRIVSQLKAQNEKKVVIDRKAFSYGCYYSHDLDFFGRIPPIHKMKYSQVIIENEDGQRRLFSDIYIGEGEEKELPDENCMHDWFDYFDLSNGDETFGIDIPYLSDLKVSDNDSRVKLRYVFKPNQEQRDSGYMNFVMESNWIKID